MKYIVSICCFLCFSPKLLAQPVSGASVSGSISMPALLNLNVSFLNSPNIRFANESDYNSGKIFSSYIKLNVASNIPWIVSVGTNNPFLTTSGINSSKVPVSIISLKPSTSQTFTPLSKQPQPILVSNNNNIDNSYTIDMLVNPSWDFPGGSYATALTFSITAQ